MDLSEAKRAGYEKLGETVCKKLNSLGYSARYVKNKNEGLKAALELIPEGASVGVPGTVTVREIGLIEELKKRGSKVSVHWDPDLKPEGKTARFLEELSSDWFVTSTNALTADEGVFVNIDGTGNRVGAMAWAPGKLLYIVGINKIAADIQTALKRVRNTATPPNVMRLNGKAPCASVGHCVNCSSPERVCRIVTMMERPPFGRECHVIIVGEELGYQMKGCWGKILTIDLCLRAVSTLALPEKLYREYIGGSGIGARLLYEMTGPGTDPLGPDNPIIWMTGPFTGTKVPTSGRHQITSRSPLTGIFGESDAGGRFGTALKRTGWDGLMVRGVSDIPVMIIIKDEEVSIEPADSLWGKDTFYTDHFIKQRFGPSCETSCIGEAGEKLVPISAIGHDGENARMSGRCGFGAVMGSKKLKAVAVMGSRETEIADPLRLMAQQKKMIPQLVEKMKGIHLLGTAGGTAAAEKMGDLPVRNWKTGNWPDAEKITGQVMADTILKKNYYCGSCPIGCGRDVEIKEGRWAGVRGAGPEYETLGIMGGSCLVSDLEAITYAADLCNRYGVDTIEAGSAVAMAMECFEEGLLTAEDLDGIRAEWGSAETLVGLTEKICRSEGAGKLLGLGVAGMAKMIPGSEKFAVHVKGLTLPAHDPRCFSTMAVGYATSNRGACHLTGASYFFEKTAVMPEFGYEKPRPRYTEGGEGIMNFHTQNLMGVMDSLKMCKFTIYGGVSFTEICEWYEAVTGIKTSVQEMALSGERIFNLKRLYNVRLGLSRKDDVLPERILSTPRRDEGTGDYTPDLEPMLDEYYGIRGWDEDGIPKEETVKRLGLDENFFK